jgi:hypothetical protein
MYSRLHQLYVIVICFKMKLISYFLLDKLFTENAGMSSQVIAHLRMRIEQSQLSIRDVDRDWVWSLVHVCHQGYQEYRNMSLWFYRIGDFQSCKFDKNEIEWDGLLSYDLSYFCLVLRLQLFNTNITMMHNSYMILKMMFWISFCSDFFVTKFTMMINDFLRLATMD